MKGRVPRRVFMCTECHKAFRTREELYMHAELCLLEAFEVEANHMLADMPQLDRDTESDTGRLNVAQVKTFSPDEGIGLQVSIIRRVVRVGARAPPEMLYVVKGK